MKISGWFLEEFDKYSHTHWRENERKLLYVSVLHFKCRMIYKKNYIHIYNGL
jgi:hypothetical protein